MPDGSALWVAVVAALGAAASFGLTGALQHYSAHAASSPRVTLRPALLVELARRPMWSLSLLVNAVGIGLQWVALANGPLTLVQPLLVTGVLFGVLFASALRRHRPDLLVLFGALLCTGGVALFLSLAQPVPGFHRMSFVDVIPLASGLAVVFALSLGIATRSGGRLRVLSLATGAGVLYGVTAGLAKLAVDDLRQGVTVMFTDWPIYLMVACGALGFLLNQYAFQAGVAMAPALAVIVVLDPLVSLGIGVLWLGETLRADGGDVLGQLIGLAIMIIGVAILSRRAPQVAGRGIRQVNR